MRNPDIEGKRPVLTCLRPRSKYQLRLASTSLPSSSSSSGYVTSISTSSYLSMASASTFISHSRTSVSFTSSSQTRSFVTKASILTKPSTSSTVTTHIPIDPKIVVRQILKTTKSPILGKRTSSISAGTQPDSKKNINITYIKIILN